MAESINRPQRIIKQATEADVVSRRAQETIAEARADLEKMRRNQSETQAEIDALRTRFNSARIALEGSTMDADATKEMNEELVEFVNSLHAQLEDEKKLIAQLEAKLAELGDDYEAKNIDDIKPTMH